jgi:hypothetical protein
MAIIAAIGIIGFGQKETLNEINEEIVMRVKKIESKWIKFEKWVKKQKENAECLEEKVLNIDNYYKGRTVNDNIKKYFAKK